MVSKLSEMRSEYNCFDEDEEPKYRALSEAIKILSKRADGDTISRQTTIDAVERFDTLDGYTDQQELICRIRQLPSAQPDVPDTNVGDMISRRAVIDRVDRIVEVNHLCEDLVWFTPRGVKALLDKLPTAHRPADEWCTNCSEYDTERKCCPRFNRVIRSAVDEQKHGRWIDLRQEGDSRFMCSVCKWKENVPTCMGKPTVWEYCPSCGARMDGDGNG